MKSADELIGAGAAAQLLGISPSGLRLWERQGRVPTSLRVVPGDRRVWRRRDLEALRDLGGVEKRARRRIDPSEAA